MNGSARWCQLLFLLLLFVVALVLAYLLGLFNGEAPVTAAHPGRPECPHDWDFKRGQVPAIWETSDIPEFNDCQRFIVYDGDQARYDELYAIFAISGLDSFADSLGGHPPSVIPPVRSTVIDTQMPPPTRPPGPVTEGGAEAPEIQAETSDTLSLPLAEIYAEGTYDMLGIRSMFSCLFVRRHADAWSARMVPVGDAEVDCRTVQPDSGKILKVNAVPLPVDVPQRPVARWGWDDTTRKQYIIITCAPNMWCEIGDHDLQASTLPTPIPTVPFTRYVKTWFDQQPLATVNGAGETVPTRISGAIYPDSTLDSRDRIADFQTLDWGRPVAHVSLEVPPDPSAIDDRAVANYKNNLNFAPTASGAALDAGGVLNRIYLRYGDRAQVLPGPLAPGDQARLADCPAAKWWAMIVSADTRPDTIYNCVEFRGHPVDFHIPGTARWRWLASDETTWQRCTQGCCELPQ